MIHKIQYETPIMMNQIHNEKPLPSADERSVNKSVILPKNIRKNGKVMPASTDVIEPINIYNFYFESANLKIDKQLTFSSIIYYTFVINGLDRSVE